MKIRIFTLSLITVLMVSLLAGCRTAEATLESVEDAVEHRVEAAGESLKQPFTPTTAPAAAPAAAAITAEQAQQIALEHAGFTADQVKFLRTDYEIDDGVPQYEVEFHQDRWEYDYEINAETGAILSYDKGD